MQKTQLMINLETTCITNQYLILIKSTNTVTTPDYIKSLEYHRKIT